MLVLRAFRDAGCVSAGGPPSHRQAELWSKRRCAFHPGFLLSFSFRAFRSAPGGKVRSLGAPREPSRAGGLGRGRRGGRSRWRRKNREPVAVVGRAAAGRPGFRGGGLFPRRQRQFRSGRAKKQATKRRTKKDFPSPKRRRFVKTGFSARYKEARRSGRPRGRKSPPGQRRPPLSAFALRRGELRARQSAFALRREEVWRRGRLCHFAVKNSGRRSRLSRFAVRNSQRRGRLSGGPQGGLQSLGASGWRPPRPFA